MGFVRTEITDLLSGRYLEQRSTGKSTCSPQRVSYFYDLIFFYLFVFIYYFYFTFYYFTIATIFIINVLRIK